MDNVFQRAIKAQLELLHELPPELAGQYRELVRDSEQIAAALQRAKARGDLLALQALTEQCATFEQKLSELSAAFMSAQRQAHALQTKRPPEGGPVA